MKKLLLCEPKQVGESNPNKGNPMIRVFGNKSGKEYEAAKYLMGLIQQEWITVNEDNSDIRIIVNHQCFGQGTQDIDLIVIGSLPEPKLIRSSLVYTTKRKDMFVQKTVWIRSFFLTIEVKDLQAENLIIQGNSIKLLYGQGSEPKDLYEQMRNQKFALKDWLREKNSMAQPIITELGWLRKLSEQQLPARPHPFLAGDVSWNMLLDIVGQLNAAIAYRNNGWVVTADPKDSEGAVAAAAYLLTGEPMNILSDLQFDQQQNTSNQPNTPHHAATKEQDGLPGKTVEPLANSTNWTNVLAYGVVILFLIFFIFMAGSAIQGILKHKIDEVVTAQKEKQQLNEYVGTYIHKQTVIEVFVRDERLFFRSVSPKGEGEFVRKSGKEFSCRDCTKGMEGLISFERDNDGKVSDLVIMKNDFPFPYRFVRKK